MKKTYTSEELKTVLEEHKKWLESEGGAEGSRADLSFANLTRVSLGFANLSEAILGFANLSEAILCLANLSDADLSFANLSDADLMGADLRGANLSDADLSFANLSDADLMGADLRGADLRGANLNCSAWPLWCGGTQAYLDRHLSLQMIYHLFNQHHQDPEIHAALEALRPLANEFRENHQGDAPALRGVEMVLAPNKENK